jgi:serine-type D-Ala-D-Ala carboxypeptidase (penicillin-binding protein 5/6)
MISNLNNLIRKRRAVIALQLGVLLFILAGLFGSMLLTPNSALNLENVAVTKQATDRWEHLTKTEVRARAAYVFDVKNGTALYQKEAQNPLPIASITKLMTSMLAFELLEDTETGSVSERALRQSGSDGLSEGEVLTLKNLRSLSLISSSNDAAYALAASVGSRLGDRDPTAQFVAGMNIRAEEIGLNSFKFKNPTGLDISETEAGAIGSAEDVSRLLAYILQNYPEVLEPTQLGVARIYGSSGTYHDVENTNEVLYLIPNLLASKTGYTDLAGGNLTVAFDAGFNRPIVVTVLGSSQEERFTDVLKLVKAIHEDLESQS